MLTREEIKKIVYNHARYQFFDDKYFDDLLNKSSYDGENLLLYSEIGFDILDTVEFISLLENDKQLNINLPDELFDNQVTLGKIIDYIYGKQRKQ